MNVFMQQSLKFRFANPANYKTKKALICAKFVGLEVVEVCYVILKNPSIPKL